MAKLAMHIASGHTVVAPMEAWVVAIFNSLPTTIQQDVLRRVGQMNGASLIPDKYKMLEDEHGGIMIVENPVVDLGRSMGNG